MTTIYLVHVALNYGVVASEEREFEHLVKLVDDKKSEWIMRRNCDQLE